MTMGLEDDGDPTTGLTGTAAHAAEVSMDLEEISDAVAGQSARKPGSSSLQTEAAKTAGKTTTGMQQIDEGNEEEEEILGMKTRNWKKINLSFAVRLNGQEGEDIRRTDYFQSTGPQEGNNTKMKHHPIMSKIANFMVAVEKKCNTVKVMSSKKKMVLDPKACMDSWSINGVKSYFAYSIVKNRQRNVQVTLYIDYGQTSTLWRMKNKILDTLKSEGLWIVNHNGPIDLVETTQIGFFAGVHPELHRKGWEENINRRIANHFNNNKAELILRAHEIPELKGFLGPLPEIQIIPLNIPGMKTPEGKNQKAISMGVSVPSKFRSLLKYILYAISEDMGIEYVDFTMKYDQQKKVLYNKLVRLHQEFMHNHKTVNIHCMEREEMKTSFEKLMEIPSVIAVDETVITERNGTWVLVMKYNDTTGFAQVDLDKIDSIIANIALMTDRKLHHHPFRKKQPIESLNLTALSGQERRFKDFTATPFSTTNSWSSRLFPPRNITTSPTSRGGGGGGRSTKTAISIDDDTTIATLTDTVSNLQQSLEQLTKEMRALGSKVAEEETRGNRTSIKIDAIECTQKVLSDGLIGLVNGINEVKDDAKKEASELKDMMRQLMINNSNNNSSPPQTQQTVNGQGQVIYNGGTGTQTNNIHNGGGGSDNNVDNEANVNNSSGGNHINGITPTTTGTATMTEKRKHDGKTPSSTPEEKEIASPDHRKQRQDQRNPIDSTVPNEIDFGKYTEDIDMEIQNNYQDMDMEHEDDTGNNDAGNNDASTRIGYVGSSAESFATRDTNSDDTTTVLEEEEQTITDHNFNNDIEEMDYTTTAAPTTTDNDGFTAVQNGSPNRNSIRQRQQERVNSSNPYSVLVSRSIKKNSNNNNNRSAKTDINPTND